MLVATSLLVPFPPLDSTRIFFFVSMVFFLESILLLSQGHFGLDPPTSEL